LQTISKMPEDFKNVNLAFSKQSEYFDAYDYQNPILVYMREQVHRHVLQFLPEKTNYLELNAGTGLDVCFFASQRPEGVFHATDLSDGMIGKLQQKIVNQNIHSQISVQQCSFLELQNIENKQFNYVFSNFGGLNCAKNLTEVTQKLIPLLADKAYITWVIMPPICLWEILTAFRGRFSYAFRRLKRNGTMAHLEGNYFKTYYFTPSDVQKAFGKQFQTVALEGLGAIIPPPEREDIAKQKPNFFEKLQKWDEKLRYTFPFHSWADHFIITLQYHQ
jgi:hypothetical protein